MKRLVPAARPGVGRAAVRGFATPRLCRWLAAGILAATSQAAQVAEPFVREGASGELVYRVEARGDRIPDFSHAGYGGGGVALPFAPVREIVQPEEGDDGARIQAALDRVSRLEPGANGIRGAVLLARGRYEIAGQLRLRVSGVVLRGVGASDEGTVLVATGTGRRTLIEIVGEGERSATGQAVEVIDTYVPVGANTVRVAADAGEVFDVGTPVVVTLPASAEWIKAIGMHVAPARTPFAWKPAEVALSWDRIVTAVEGDRLTLDAPLTNALDRAYGAASVTPYTWPGRLRNVGVEQLRCASAYDATRPNDEEHAWIAISLDRVEDAWVDSVTAAHFVSSAVHVGAEARAVTVQDCVSLAPVSENAGYRRHSFHTSGQLTLFQRCRAEDGRHDFTVGYFAGGPNVFLDCQASRASDFSGPIGSWASGVLYDNVAIDGAGLALDNLETWNGGVGWAAANSVLWQCSAANLICRSPPTARNYAIGVWGQFRGDGAWDQVDEFVRPVSLYRAQLEQRRGAGAVDALAPRPSREERARGAASPTVTSTGMSEEGGALARETPSAAGPSLAAETQASAETPPSSEGQASAETQDRTEAHALELRGGWLIDRVAGRLFVGAETPTTWWRGSLSPKKGRALGPHLTRFAPGHSGRGATDDLEMLTRDMKAKGEVVLRHHYGLWYDRRRDDHERMRRASADAWPPFYEQPWARSGYGEAWDRLSRYDLTKFNPWYFGRLREFAELGHLRGVVLVNEMYFQHNILESGAHWVDSPWRPVNALQETGFPEPPPFTGDTIAVAEAFYDLSHPVRRELHRAYIRQCLANLADQPNVIHTTSAEFSGPLAFVQFWLDVAAEWQAETGRDPLLALSAPKDVQDAILADPRRAALVDVIDFTYWWRTDTELYAPRGGENLAPRQHLRKWRGGRATAASLAGMVREYRQRFPEKAVTTGFEQPDPWIYAAAGGSFPALPSTTEPRLLESWREWQPVPLAGANRWALGRDGRVCFVASLGREPIDLHLAHWTGPVQVHRLDPRTGRIKRSETHPGGGRSRQDAASEGTTLLWISP